MRPTIAWLTDPHLNFVGRGEIGALCESIRSSGADAVLITGDIATAEHLCWCLKHLADRIQKPVYFVLGNHDYYGSSIQRVNFEVGGIVISNHNLIWLSRSEVIELTPDTCLVGYEGLADGRLGDPEGSAVMLNDYYCVFRAKPTAVPARCRPAFRSDGDQHSGGKPTTVPEQSDRLFVM